MNKKIVVFAGNICLKERESFYFDLAYRTGKALAQNGFVTITGAGPGLMDQALKGAQEAGGDTIGIGLDFEGRKNSIYVNTLTLFDKLGPRQDKLIELGDAYMALPGGVGTLYEIFNILALKRINEMNADKPLILLGEYYDAFKEIFTKMVGDGFAGPSVHTLYAVAPSPEEAVAMLKANL
ncbi:MAG: LOG family protein [Patescibacteria group bacterium]|nr:LOG family protein [Patescibacteria group bacterium]